MISRSELQALAAERDAVCMSVYLPVYAAGMDAQTNPIRLKNAIQRVEAALKDRGVRRQEIETLLKPLWELHGGDNSWRYRDGGLAVFRSSEAFQWHVIPVEFEEMVRVADRFYLKPLLPGLVSDGRFFVLAVSRKSVRLLDCTRETASELRVDGLPRDIVDALGPQVTSEQIQFHSGDPGGRAMFHGHGAGTDDRQTDLMRYLRVVNRSVHDAIADHSEPLVVAAADPVHGLYQRVNTYPHLAPTPVPGNPDDLSASDLRDRAWEVVEPAFRRELDKARQAYEQAAGTDRATVDLPTIVNAACDGRIAVLFVALGEQRWGAHDPDARSVEIHDEPLPGDDELLDLAAVQALLSGASVYAVRPDEVPGDGPAAAVLRY